jgi:RNA recognition motif-containing protein
VFPRKPVTDKSGKTFLRRQGFAFAELASKEEAERAVNELNETTLESRRVIIKMARATEKKPRPQKEKEVKEPEDKVCFQVSRGYIGRNRWCLPVGLVLH